MPSTNSSIKTFSISLPSASPDPLSVKDLLIHVAKYIDTLGTDIYVSDLTINELYFGTLKEDDVDFIKPNAFVQYWHLKKSRMHANDLSEDSSQIPRVITSDLSEAKPIGIAEVRDDSPDGRVSVTRLLRKTADVIGSLGDVVITDLVFHD